ncbi:MAG: hypothetical protein BGO78_11605 [Chloroflexi bacterium 44-23]|nr:MAG: hypothetical protein BGO78_11605 [Chloroflexi bacterium 44-23]
MFYALLFLWLIACVICNLLTRIQKTLLSSSCPYVAIGGVAAATIAYLSGSTQIAIIVLAVTLYLWAILRWSLHKQQKAVSIKA